MTMARVHVVGAGLAGLSAAVRLTERGVPVTVHEAQAHAGGRCRSFHDPRLGREIDNGNHLVLTGNSSVAAYRAAIGATGLEALPEARFAFVDLADGRRWQVAMNDGPLPWWVISRRRRVPGTAVADYLSGVSLALARDDATVAEAIAGRGPLWRAFWEPLTLAAINAVPARASARLLWRVVAETFLRGGRHARPMLAPRGLGPALVDPGVAWLAARGVEIRYGRVLRAVETGDGRATVLRFSDGEERLGPGDGVVLALPPSRLRPLDLVDRLPEDAASILNAFFVVPEAAVPALDGAPRILGVLSGRTHWIFRRGDVVSLTVSASGELGLDAEPAETLLPSLWAETRSALGLAAGIEPVAARLNRERRATFDQSPAGVRMRPRARTRLANLWLAGDATDTGLPATLEGAVRSGETAAQHAQAA